MATTNTAATGLRNLERELICFICTEIFYQPLTVIDCLHTFCGSCLKEWFTHQHRKASSSRSTSTTSNPYTCPTCRAAVKDVQRMAFVNTLLEMFLTENSDRGRTGEDKAEMQQIYKPGENILPKVERRRERRARREGDAIADRERRMLEEAQARSLHDMQRAQASAQTMLAPPGVDETRSGSHDREERRQRRRERERQRIQQYVETDIVQEPSNGVVSIRSHSPPISSPRHPDAVEARQRERPMAHQASLRSLVSASESSTGTGDSLDEARIMQEILAEGLLDGIDVDSLTEAEQDVWAERIAEAYRQRHPRRSGPGSSGIGSPASSLPSNRDSLVAIVGGGDRLRPTEANERRRSSSRQRAGTTPSPGRDSQSREQLRTVRTLPPSSTSAMPSNSSVVITHRRRDSDQTRERSSSQLNLPPSSPTRMTTGSRSEVDISRPSGAEIALTNRTRRLSAEQRSSTEPREVPRASEVWMRSSGEPRRQQPNGIPHIASVPKSPTPSQVIPRSEPVQPVIVSTSLDPASEPVASTTVPVPAGLDAAAQFDEPSISCFRCNRSDIQYEVYKHCRLCVVDLCLTCYRQGRGCSHWYGFGHAAMAKFEASKTTNEATEFPHVLFGRQYKKPEATSVVQSKSAPDGTTTLPVKTTSDPSLRICDGHFCDRCGSFANSQFWLCDYCNDGEWGFCERCVHTHHCCTHPLLAVTSQPPSQSTTTAIPLVSTDVPANPTSSELLTATAQHSENPSRPASARSFASSFAGLRAGYVNLTITVSCDLCQQPISPAHLRFHCPFHPSPNPAAEGDYDICTYCYHNLVKTGRMRREDGPAGWRKCPSGHRMIIASFEDDNDGGMRRVVKHDLVGGWRITEEDMLAWTQARIQQQTQSNGSPAHSPPLPGATRGTWSWREDANNPRRITRARTSTLTNKYQDVGVASLKFPPDGGFGLRAQAQWSYYPEEGEEGQGELMFPRGAEITEIEDVNGDWWSGVYAGDVGVLPSGYVREIK